VRCVGPRPVKRGNKLGGWGVGKVKFLSTRGLQHGPAWKKKNHVGTNQVKPKKSRICKTVDKLGGRVALLPGSDKRKAKANRNIPQIKSRKKNKKDREAS